MKFVFAAVVVAVAVAQELAPVENVIEVTGTATPSSVARLRMPLMDRTSVGASGKLERRVYITPDGHVQEDIDNPYQEVVVGGPAAPSPYDDTSGLVDGRYTSSAPAGVHGYGAAVAGLQRFPGSHFHVVGAPASNRLFTRSSSGYVIPAVDAEITPEDLPETETRFGSVLSLTYDPLTGLPSVIAVCGGSADRVYLLENLAENRDLSNQNWTLVASLEIAGPEACEVHHTTLVVGSPSTDSVHVFEAGPEIGDWADVQETRVLSGATGEMFGAAVGLTRRSIFVGAPGAADGSGVVREFTLNGTVRDEFVAPEEGVTGWGSNLAVSDPFVWSTDINFVQATLLIAPQMGGDLVGLYGRRSTLADIAAGTDTSAFELIDTVARPERGSQTHFGQVLDAQFGSFLIGGSADDEALPESLIYWHWEVDEGAPVLDDRVNLLDVIYQRQTWVDVAGDRITAMAETKKYQPGQLLMTWNIGDGDAVADGATPDEILIPDSPRSVDVFAIQSDGTTFVREMVFGPDHDPQELDLERSFDPEELDLSGGVGAVNTAYGFQAMVKTDIDGDGTIAWVAGTPMEIEDAEAAARAVDVAAGGETIAVGFGANDFASASDPFVPPFVMVYKRTAPLQWAEHQRLELEGPGRSVVPIRSFNDVIDSPTQVEMSEDGLLLVVAHGGLLAGETAATRPEDATEAITLVFERASVDDNFVLVQQIRIESRWTSFEHVGHSMSLSGGPDGALLALLVGDKWDAESKVAVFHRPAAGADFVEIARVGGAVPGVHVSRLSAYDRKPTNVFCLRGSRLVVSMIIGDTDGTDPMLGDNHLWVVDFDVEVEAVDTPVELFEPTRTESESHSPSQSSTLSSSQSQTTKPSDDDDDDDSKKASGAAQTGPASVGLSLAVAVVVAAAAML